MPRDNAVLNIQFISRPTLACNILKLVSDVRVAVFNLLCVGSIYLFVLTLVAKELRIAAILKWIRNCVLKSRLQNISREQYEWRARPYINEC